MEEEWKQLIADLLAEWTTDNEEIALRFAAIRNSTEADDIHAMWCSGMSDKTVRRMLRSVLTELGYGARRGKR